jgi:hypothetical protein
VTCIVAGFLLKVRHIRFEIQILGCSYHSGG